MRNSISKAKCLLVHYFRLAGVVTDSDNVAEIEEIVDCIVDYISEEIQESSACQELRSEYARKVS